MDYKITKELRDGLVDLLKGIKGNIQMEIALLGFAAKLEHLEEIKETAEEVENEKVEEKKDTKNKA